MQLYELVPKACEFGALCQSQVWNAWHNRSICKDISVWVQVLSASELDWLNEYHHAVWEKISPRLQDDPDMLEWLRVNTQPISAPAAEPAAVAARPPNEFTWLRPLSTNTASISQHD